MVTSRILIVDKLATSGGLLDTLQVGSTQGNAMR